MDHIAAAEQKIVSDRMQRRLQEANVAAQTQLAPIQDHINFTLQKAYFKCAYDCFERGRRQEEINNCVEHCSVPVMQAQNIVETEMGKFQERMNRSLMVCQDKFEAQRLQQMKTGAMNELESCVNKAVDDSIEVLPHLLNHLKESLRFN